MYGLNNNFNIMNGEVTDGQVVRAGVSVTWMFYHDLEVMSLNPGQVELGVHSTYLIQKYQSFLW